MRKALVYVSVLALIMAMVTLMACPSPEETVNVSGQYPLQAGPRLASLSVAEASQEAKLSPSFDPNIFEYIVYVPNVTMGVKVAATAPEGYTLSFFGEYGVDNRVLGTGSFHTPSSAAATGWPNGTWPYGQPVVEYFPDGKPVAGCQTEGAITVKTTLNDGSAAAAEKDYVGGRVVQSYVYVSDGTSTNTYSIKMVVEDKRHIQGYFLQDLGYFYDPDGDITYTPDGSGNVTSVTGTAGANTSLIRYNLYVPKVLSDNEELPVVYTLHGSGLRNGPASGILTRYEMSTIWAEDSEQGHNKCIVVSPQASIYANGSAANWYGGTSPYSTIAREGEGAYELLQKVIAGDWATLVQKHQVSRLVTLQTRPGQVTTAGTPGNISVNNGLRANITFNNITGGKTGVKGNTKKVYITGLSMGGGGTMATLKSYAGTFAAAMPMVANVKWQDSDFTANPALKNVAVKFVHDRYDPTVDFQYHKDNMAVANAQTGWRVAPTEVIYSTDTVKDYYYEAPHYSWVRAYRDQSLRNWLFAQALP